MLDINLLPWREVVREKERNKRIVLLLLVIMLLTSLFIFARPHQTMHSVVQIKKLDYPIQYVGFLQQKNISWALLMLPSQSLSAFTLGASPLQQGEHISAIFSDKIIIQFPTYKKIIKISSRSS